MTASTQLTAYPAVPPIVRQPRALTTPFLSDLTVVVRREATRRASPKA
jgi:hypothetical protein